MATVYLLLVVAALCAVHAVEFVGYTTDDTVRYNCRDDSDAQIDVMLIAKCAAEYPGSTAATEAQLLNYQSIVNLPAQPRSQQLPYPSFYIQPVAQSSGCAGAGRICHFGSGGWDITQWVQGHGSAVLGGVCVTRSGGTGTVGGDPHFHTFDGLLHHFQGLSDVWYTAVHMPLGVDGKSTMQLEMRTQSCNGLVFAEGQCLDAVRLMIDDVLVSQINTHGSTRANTKQIVKNGYNALILADATTEFYNLTFENDNVTHVMVSNGFQYWVRGMWMKVEVPPHYKHRVTGLLGTFNGDHTDDLTARHGDVLSFEKPAVEQFLHAKASIPVQEFGHSWISRNMTGGVGHTGKFGAQSLQETLKGAIVVNYTRGDVSNNVADRCTTLVMETLKRKCGNVPWAEAEKLIITCQYDLNVCPDCVDMVVDGTEMHCL